MAQIHRSDARWLAIPRRLSRSLPESASSRQCGTRVVLRWRGDELDLNPCLEPDGLAFLDEQGAVRLTLAAALDAVPVVPAAKQRPGRQFVEHRERVAGRVELQQAVDGVDAGHFGQRSRPTEQLCDIVDDFDPVANAHRVRLVDTEGLDEASDRGVRGAEAQPIRFPVTT